ncbi:MAG: hypothetical protein JJU31_01950 [Wenzhouxiangella sp.]|nr:hypothetical protein [Wenzhouxiangella sp.]MCH8478830.1 hypothetical protein [Wenzhouxiangella sp.]
MNQALHHIRLAAGFETESAPPHRRFLDRGECEQLTAALAADLTRVIDKIDRCLLVVGGTLLEPGGLLQPGLPAWQALQELARPALRDPSSGGQILAIGAYGGRLPDRRLQPPADAAEGRFVALPMLLSCPADIAPALESSLEAVLFERGSVHPPARALLATACGLETVHGQLLTANDLIALQHVQMDTAGLGAFWTVIEHALTAGAEDCEFALPGQLQARWQAGANALGIDFVSFDKHPGSPAEYALWVRAFRSLITLADSHGLPRQINSSLVHDRDLDCLVESRGRCRQTSGMTEHVHPDCGLIAWTRVEDSHQFNLYPLSGRSLRLVAEDTAARRLPRHRHPSGICYDADTHQLRPAT